MFMTIRAVDRSRKAERGVALVQFAFLTPILVMLFLGTWSIGYSCYIYSVLEEDVRAGARYASTITYDASNTSAYTTAVQNLVTYGDPGGGTQAIVPGLQTSQVNVSVSPSLGQPTSVTVSISGYQLLTPWMARFSLSNKPWVTLPYLGNYVPL